MDLGLRGRVALITGASSGIGEAVALALAAEGCKVAVSARRLDKLQGVVERAKAAGAPDACALAADQTDFAALQGLIPAAAAKLGPVEILIANGGGPRTGQAAELTEADWDLGFRQVMKSKLALVSAALPSMRARKWGRIVALESITVKQPFPNMALSNSFRVAVAGALKTLAAEVAKDGITVNTIATGLIQTDRFRSLYDTPEKVAKAVGGVPMGRPGTVAEYAPLVTFLCGAPAAYVTGQTIAIDGGLISGVFG